MPLGFQRVFLGLQLWCVSTSALLVRQPSYLRQTLGRSHG